MFLGLSSKASAATYYVWANGGHGACAASDKTAAQTNSQANAFNMTGINACSGANALADDDQVLFSDDGGDFAVTLVIPSGGSGSGSEITYANVPSETPVIAITSGYLLNTNSKSNIIIDGFTINYTGGSPSTNIGIPIGAGSNIQFKNVSSDMNGQGYNMRSTSILSDVIFDNVTLVNCSLSTSRCLHLSGSSNTNITIRNSSIENKVVLANVTNLIITDLTSAGDITVSGSNVAISDSTLTGGITLSSVTTGTINDTTASGIGIYLVNSSEFTINDSSVSNVTVDGGFSVNNSQDITYNHCTATNNLYGFRAYGTSSDITYNNCTADNNTNVGFVPTDSATNITYNRCEASYNGAVNVVTDGGGFLPHGMATNVHCYYCIAHHNYNEGIGDVGDSTGNFYYNSVNWANGHVAGDIFKGSTVTTPSVRSNVYYRKTNGGDFVVNNTIFGLGKPREILDTAPEYTTLDYNVYLPLDDSKFYNTGDDENNTSWATYHETQEPNSQNADPQFVNASGNYSLVADFQLQYNSPAIDSGTDVGLTTDYLGNHIYGTPDIGAFEYQPPHTMGTDEINIAAGARIYADGSFRHLSTTGSIAADLSVAPSSGWPSSDYSQWMDVSINTWSTSGTYEKNWTETGSVSDVTTVHTVGDLALNTYYNVTVDDVLGADITGDDCTGGRCLSDTDGTITFTYAGGYSSHEFDVSQDVTAPTGAAITSVLATSTTALSVVASSATDADPGLAALPYQFKRTGADAFSWQAETTYTDTGLSPNTRYGYRIRAKDLNENISSYSLTSSGYTLAPTPTGFRENSATTTSATLIVDALPNDTSGSSGYLFSHTGGGTSGWITTNTWTESNLSCGSTYTYTVKYRNGDGIETSTATLTAQTSRCDSGTSSGENGGSRREISTLSLPYDLPQSSTSSVPSASSVTSSPALQQRITIRLAARKAKRQMLAVHLPAVPSSSPSTYRVKVPLLNLRADSRTNAFIRDVLKQGTPLTVIRFVQNTWAQVRLQDGRTGFVYVPSLEKVKQ